MKSININQLKNMMLLACENIINSEKELTEIDSVIGDGDHGVSMKIAFTNVKELLETNAFTSCSDLLKKSGIEIIKSAGGTSGLFFGLLFVDGEEEILGKEELTSYDFYRFFDKGVKKIVELGNGKPGDKTMLDPLFRVVASLEETKECDIEETLNKAKDAAYIGVEDTKAMISNSGRSKGFGDLTKNYPDPGAVSIFKIFSAFAQTDF